MGQLNIEARYPFHFHLTGINVDSYIKDCAVHDSNFRCFVIHGTHNLTVRQNTAYNVRGHCLYIEDGVEENNTIMYNAIGHVHPIHHIAQGSCNGQWICIGCNDSWHDKMKSIKSNYETYIYNSSQLQLPVDTAASGFYITNTYNYVIGFVCKHIYVIFCFALFCFFCISLKAKIQKNNHHGCNMIGWLRQWWL